MPISLVLTPAAQYLRMSTEDQPNSIPMQRDAIQRYAAGHGFEIVETYCDAGKSGLYIRNRPGLSQLLRDVLGGKCRFQVILVYDVSRWGRFQDTDESAHYEFLCRRAGIQVHYCAEQFENDLRLPNAILKSLKRIMAAEYSREISARNTAVKKRLASQGFHVGAAAVYGLRRLLLCGNGHMQILQKGEHKNLRSDHVVLAPGPKREVDCVRLIFSLAAKKKNSPHEIAQELNLRKFRYFGNQPWDYVRVQRVLKNIEYTGCSVWGRRSQIFGGRTQRVPRDAWVMKPGAFPPVVTPEEFAAAQKQTARRKCIHKPDKYYLDRLLKLHAKEREGISSSTKRERHTVAHMCI